MYVLHCYICLVYIISSGYVSLILFLFTVVKIGFKESMYTVMEQDDVEVCVEVLTGNLAPGVILEFKVQTMDGSAFGMSISDS